MNEHATTIAIEARKLRIAPWMREARRGSRLAASYFFARARVAKRARSVNDI
jgi:hypothetical protein